MKEKKIKPIDISNELHQLQNSHKFDIESEDHILEKTAESTESKTQKGSEIKYEDRLTFKNIIMKFIKHTAPKVKAAKRNNNTGYEAVISKDEVLLTTYPANNLKDPVTHIFKCSQLTLINQQSKQEEPDFMGEFMKQYQQVFDDISSKKATVEIVK